MEHKIRLRGRRGLLAALALALPGAMIVAVPTAGAAPEPTPAPTHKAKVDRQEETGKVGFIGAPAGRPIDVGLPAGTAPGAVAKAVLQQNAGRLGLASEKTSLRVSKEHPSSAGGRSVRVTQLHAGLPVLGGEFTVTLDEDRDVLSVLGEASPIGKEVATDPEVGARPAIRTAIAKVAREADVAPGRLTADDPVLMFYDPRLLGAPGPFQEARLSWVMEVRSARPAVAHTVVVDAASGRVALSFSMIAHALDRVVCDADNTSAHSRCTAPVWTETSQPTGADPDVVAAFEYAGDTYDFFASRFGRDSLDDAGMTLVSTVDYCPSPGDCPYQNAFWDGSQMTYGDGFATADDVVGHELAHGVTDFSSSLYYYMQSGAISESMSDIFGELIDLTNGGGNDAPDVRWLMGEDVPGFGAIRDMADPPVHGDPDRMNSPLYAAGADDSGGVHSNSGVSNKAAFLLVDGGSFNGRTVDPIGMDKAALLFYAVNNDLLVSGSDFADLANALRQACATLAGGGTGGFTSGDCDEVEQAVLATEMDLDPSAAPTDVVGLCPVGRPVFSHRDDLESPAGQLTTMAMVGAETWSYPQNPNDYDDYDATYTTSGEHNIFGDNPHYVTDSALRMTDPVTVPAGGFLHFNHAYGFEAGYDGGVLEYSTAGPDGPWVDAGTLFETGDGAGGYDRVLSSGFGNPLGGRNAFTGLSNGYGASRADLSTLAGQSVMFRWRIGTDSENWDFGWFIDDISVYFCSQDTTAPDTTITSGPASGSTVPVLEPVTFGFSATEEGSTFECSLDGGDYAACSSPTDFSGLALGSHTFAVRATDVSGNTDASPAARTFTVALPDTTPPDTRITKHPQKATFLRKATFAWKATEPGGTSRCKVDRKPWKPCSSAYTVKVRPGNHKFQVRAGDAAGNVDPTPAVWRWKVKRRS